MPHKFGEIAFTDTIKRIQSQMHSRAVYEKRQGQPGNDHLITEKESSFIQQRDSFYMASVGETGWPYVQHRGGPIGFLKVLNNCQLAYADFSGNRQYISTGNFRTNNRVAIILVDYPNRRRLKILGTVTESSDPIALSTFPLSGYRAKVERIFTIDVHAHDWNCPQHITPRYTEQEILARF